MAALTYVGRPGLSPAIAALLAMQRIRRRDRILDVGCGTGTDLLTLARWGFRNLHGIDPDRPAIATARRRATRAGLADRVSFHELGAERLREEFRPKTFDVVLHTLVANNLGKEKGRHFREIASVMKPAGLLVLHERVGRTHDEAAPGRFAPLPGLLRSFELTQGVGTQLAERPAPDRGPHYARVVLWLGRPRK